MEADFQTPRVLFRAGFHSFDLEGELTRTGIPYVKYGGFKFLESVHIRDVLAYLRVVDNPVDTVSWNRVLKLIPGVGQKTAKKLADIVVDSSNPEKFEKVASTNRKYGASLKHVAELISGLRDKSGSIADKIEEINRHYFPYLKENFDNFPKRMRDLEQLADMTVGYRNLNRFLNDMALEPPNAEGVRDDCEKDSLILSTIHSAKGLEWSNVIIIWATEGRIPPPMARESPDDLEEERRLLYVATTRAKRNLVIIAPRMSPDRQRGESPAHLSRFIDEVPPDYFQSLTIEHQNC